MGTVGLLKFRDSKKAWRAYLRFSGEKILAVVFSVGVRPCTGAILVLVFALTQGVFWAGVAATFAMAIGTAITVAALATLALGSRELALRLGGGAVPSPKPFG